jgi:hypothetical protein
MSKADTEKKTLVSKLVEVFGGIGQVKKGHRNPHFGYDYISEGQVNAIIGPRLAERNILFTTSVLTMNAHYGDGKAGVFVEVTTEHGFTDADSGETLVGKSAGVGWDSGDKGVYKAITGATKYFLMKTFMITDEADDPEAGDQAPAPKPKGAEGHRRTKAYEEETGEGDKKVAGDLIELKAYLTQHKIPDGFLLRLLEEKKLIDGHTKTVAAIKPGILRRVLAPKSLENLLSAWKQQQADEDTGSQTEPTDAQQRTAAKAAEEPSPFDRGEPVVNPQPPKRKTAESDEYDQTRATRKPVDEGTDSTDLLQQEGYDNWREVEIHFGQQKGKLLGKIPQKSLQWWVANWTPKPYRGTWDEKDLVLDAALVLASAELGGGE